MHKKAKCRCQDPSAVAILARISDKDKQTQASIEAQIRETREKLIESPETEQAGLHVVGEYAVRHRGSDLAGDKTYMQMIADARAGRFSRLFLHKFDRLARRAYDRETYWHILTRECGIEVRAALEPYDLSTRAGKLTKKTSEFISDIYLDNLAEEVLKGMRQKVLSGGWVGKAPFGYVNRREEIVHGNIRRWVEVHPDHGPTVRILFREWETGSYTLDTMAKWLNSHGYLWEKGLPWRRDRVHRALTNPFYCGRMIWNGIEAQGTHKPLVSVETFERCVEILREHDRYRDRRVKHIYTLNRVLWFDELKCGTHTEHQEHANASYYRSKRPGPGGSQVYLRCEAVDSQVPRLLKQLRIPEALQAHIKKLYETEVESAGSPEQSEVERLQRRIAALDEERGAYIRLVAQGKISEEEFDRERNRVAEAISTSRQELDLLQQRPESQMSGVDLALTLSGHMDQIWQLSDAARRRELAQLVFKRVAINNAGEVIGYRTTEPQSWIAGIRRMAPAILQMNTLRQFLAS